jgi:PIN domain nuclease of toxin-antitoxin system
VAAVIHLDTHVVWWLYEGRTEMLSPRAAVAIEDNDLCLSPLVTLELDYLHEIGRLTLAGRAICDDLAVRIGVTTSRAALPEIVRRASALTWTRDPFDRLLVAQAMADGCRLLTRDANILEHFEGAFWA